jgi:hypothetical protein
MSTDILEEQRDHLARLLEANDSTNEFEHFFS